MSSNSTDLGCIGCLVLIAGMLVITAMLTFVVVAVAEQVLR